MMDNPGQRTDSTQPGDNTESLIRENIALLSELLADLRTIDDDLFASQSGQFAAGQTVGRHCRHICDHYEALLRSVAGATPCDVLSLDYDDRARCTETELNRDRCIARLEDYKQHLRALSGVSGQQSVQLSADVYVGGQGRTTMMSTLARELGFLASHTTHHSALVAILLQGLSVQPAPELGRAAATRAHESA